jgi:ketosteroid isomerase-like protein
VTEAEEVIGAVLDAFNARDRDGFVAAFSDDIEAHTLLAELAGEPYRGRAGLRRWWEDALEAWDYREMTLERVIGTPESGVAFIDVSGKGKASGVEFDMHLGMVFRLHEGRIEYFRIYQDRDEALRAAGHS